MQHIRRLMHGIERALIGKAVRYCARDARGVLLVDPLLTEWTGGTLGMVGLPSREDRHGEEDPGVAGSQVAVGPAQATPLISASRRPAPGRGLMVGALGRSQSSAASGWFVPEAVLGDRFWAVVRPRAGAASRSARRSSSMIMWAILLSRSLRPQA
jgi:hypothetical protein